MKNEKLLAGTLKKQLAGKADELPRFPGTLGDGAGNLYFGTGRRSVYVRIGNQLAVAKCPRVQPVDGLAVWVGYANEERTLYQVLSTRNEDIGNSVAGGGYAPASRYRYLAVGGGQDPLYLEQRAWLPLRVGMTSPPSLSVSIYEGYVWTGTEFLYIAGQSVDLTAQVPSTSGKAALVMLTVDTSGAIVQTKGSEVDVADLCPDADEFANAPAVPAGTVEVIALIRVYEGQTTIREGRSTADGTNRGFTDFIDVRGGYFGVPYSVLEDTKDPTGWVDPDGIDVAYDSTERKITLTGTLDYYWRGRKYSLESPWTSDAHADVEAKYFLYSTDGATFEWSTDSWEFYELMVAKVNYGTSDKFGLRETHGLMPWQVHEELHETISAFRESGGELTAGTYTENTASDAANSPGFDAAELQDEDLHNTIPAWSQGTYTTMRIGAASVATFDTTATLPFRHGASYLYYNTPSTGAETAAANNRYLNVYQILVPTTSDTDSQKYRMLMLQPQAQYTSLTAAKAEDPRTLVFGDLTTTAPEFVVYARITYVTASGDANNGKCRIATGGITYLAGTKLSQVSVSGFVSPTAENVPFTPAGTISATNVQAAIEEVAAEAGGGGTVESVTGDGVDNTDPANPVIALSADDLTDVDTTTDAPVKNEVLKWNGTNWVPAAYNASFTFAIASFSDGESSPQEIGSGVWKAIGAISFTATYDNGPAAATPYVSKSGWSNLNMTGAGYVGPTTNAEAVNYPSVGASITFQLNATDGTDSDTETQSVAFYNRRFWGVSEIASGYDEADIEGLDDDELSNSKAKTFTVDAGAGEYIIFAYPSRLGTATFTVGGFEGGFEAPETVSITNASGYTEDYYVYRSTNPNLGNTTVVTS